MTTPGARASGAPQTAHGPNTGVSWLGCPKNGCGQVLTRVILRSNVQKACDRCASTSSSSLKMSQSCARCDVDYCEICVSQLRAEAGLDNSPPPRKRHRGLRFGDDSFEPDLPPVSYTHLTLPTICSV